MSCNRMETKGIKRQRALVLIGACLFQLALLGTFANCVGIMMGYMRAEFHISVTQISLYNTIRSVVSGATASLLTRVFMKSRKPWFMIINNLMLILSFLLLIPGGGKGILYVSAALHGSSFGVSAIMVMDVLRRWFPQNVGAASGLAMMFSGIGGVIFNPLIACLLDICGWRMTILWVSLITLGLTLAGVRLMFWKRNPVDSDLYATDKESTLQQKEIFMENTDRRKNRKLFFLCCAAIMGGAVALQFNNYVAIYAQSCGYSLKTGAALAAAVMAGNIIGKLLFGAASDRFGIWRTMSVTLSGIILALICFNSLSKHQAVLFAAAVLFGGVFALFMMSIYKLCPPVFGEQEGMRQVGRLTGVNNLLNALASVGIGTIFDANGTFRPALWIIIASCAVSVIAVFRLDGYAAENRHSTN